MTNRGRTALAMGLIVATAAGLTGANLFAASYAAAPKMAATVGAHEYGGARPMAVQATQSGGATLDDAHRFARGWRPAGTTARVAAQPVAPGMVPEPGTWAMLIAGLLGFAAIVRRRVSY